MILSRTGLTCYRNHPRLEAIRRVAGIPVVVCRYICSQTSLLHGVFKNDLMLYFDSVIGGMGQRNAVGLGELQQLPDDKEEAAR